MELRRFICGRYPISGSRPLRLYFNKFRSNLGVQQFTSGYGWRCFVSRWKQIGLCQWQCNLHFIFHSIAAIRPHADKRQPHPFLARGFDKLCITAELGFDHGQLGHVDKCTNTQSHQSAGSGHSFTGEQQRFLPPHFPIGGAVLVLVY